MNYSAVHSSAQLSDTPIRANRDVPSPNVIGLPLEANSTTAVSWAAVLAGAAGAAALSLVLLILGTGLGLSSVSPWTGQGLSASALGGSTIAWLTFTQLAAAGMGGYLAGRMRTRWHLLHTDEVYFRDTVHGFLAWAIATLVMASVLATTIASVLGAGTQAAGTTVGVSARAAIDAAQDSGKFNSSSRIDYFMDSMFRKDAAAAILTNGNQTDAASQSANLEARRIVERGLLSNSLTADDSKYLAQLVAQRSGMTPVEAKTRVDDTFMKLQNDINTAEARARETADKARKAAANAALWMFVSLLAGAFVASLLATYGGQRRDL